MLKRLLITTTFVAAVVLGSVGGRMQYARVHPSHPPNVVQVRASHMLSFLDKDEETATICSSTVIARHALLTAQHCNMGKDESKTIRIDRSARVYNLLAASYDSRDHVIYLVDGPAFQDICPYVTRLPKIGEPVFVEGFGEEVYPAVQKAGKVVKVYDPSEVDAGQQMFFFTNAVIHGDSGAAVFSLDGSLLGVVTWHMDGGGSGYALDYPPEIIRYAKAFEGKDSE